MTTGTPTFSRPAVLLARLLCAAALALAAWLTWQKWNGSISSIAGCGDAGGCQQILGGEWSQWMLVPVTLLAAGVYATLLLITAPPVEDALGRTGHQLQAGAAFLILLAALWFGGLMLHLKTVCPWCLAMHVLGGTASVILMVKLWRERAENGGVAGAALISAVAAMAVLIAGQLYGPRPATHLVTAGGLLPTDAQPQAAAQEPAPASRTVYFFGRELAYDPAALPLLGDPAARHILVEYFDYTCPSCRDMYGDLVKLKATRGADFAVIVLPVPLNRSCNPWMKPGMNDHAGACELAGLALAVWQAAPAKFPAFHDQLMTTSPTVAGAMARAKELCGEKELDAALQSPAVKSLISLQLSVFNRLTSSNIKMPKLLLKDETMMHGTARTTEEFLQAIDQIFPR